MIRSIEETFTREERTMVYPKTPYFSFSSNFDNDDIVSKNLENFLGKQLVITEKIDGSNIKLEWNGRCYETFTRGGNPTKGHFFSYLKRLIYTLPPIEKNYSIFCEYVAFAHNIDYKEIPNILYIISVFDKSTQQFLSWDDTRNISNYLGLPTVPELFIGIINSTDELKGICLSFQGKSEISPSASKEGVVVRLYNSFHIKDFPISVAKCVFPDFQRRNNLLLKPHSLCSKARR